jgi:Tfp pilus assembly protein PilF
MNRRERRAAGKIKTAPARPARTSPAAAFYQAGIVHLREGRMLDAQVSGQQALTADPAHADSLHLMSLITIDAGHFDLAAEWARRAVALNPQPQYLFTLGSVLRQQKQLEEALAVFEQATALRPDSADLFRAAANVMVDLNLTDRAIAAFQHLLKLNPRDRDAAHNLVSLLYRSGKILEALPFLQLSDAPCLPAPDAARVQAWDERLGPHDRLRVGLVWSGNSDHNNDQNRSITLGVLSELFDLDAAFVSLQKDPGADDRALLARSEVIDFTADLADFAETSALMACLDLVISVDTSVAHLAGALGRPVWTLLPYAPDLRGPLDRDDGPCYPTMRLFRQGPNRSYAEVIAQVRGELNALIAARD